MLLRLLQRRSQMRATAMPASASLPTATPRLPAGGMLAAAVPTAA
jgi:hypothetical protein